MSKSNGKSRAFEDKPAVREEVPLLLGLMGPSGGGKTYSALRLATGIQRVAGGDTYVIDTEARRSLHYAEHFNFRHVQFDAPFGPLDYLAAIDHCVDKGAKTIIVDSMSHEHEGPGGVLEMHEQQLDKIAGNDFKKRERVKMLAWAKPKQERRRLINSILQRKVHFIFCFRAKEKLKIKKGEEPKPMGFMPIAGEEFVYEMALCALLLPNAGGVPTWQSGELGEQQMIKLPEQFKTMFRQSKPLDEDTGEALAKWAAGDAAPQANDPDADKARTWFAKNLPKAETDEHVAKLEKRIAKAPASVQAELRSMCEARRAELSGGSFDDEDPFDEDDGNEPPANVVQWGDDEDTPITDLSVEQLTSYHDEVQAEMGQDPTLEDHLEQVRAEITRRQRAEAAAE